MEDCLTKKHLGGSICSPCDPSDKPGTFEFSAPKSFASMRTQNSHLDIPSGFDDGEARRRKLQLYVEQVHLSLINSNFFEHFSISACHINRNMLLRHNIIVVGYFLRYHRQNLFFFCSFHEPKLDRLSCTRNRCNG